MPGKTGKKGKKKGKKKGASKKLPGRNETAEVVVKRLLKCYEKNCAFTESQMCPGIRDSMKKCIENNSLLVKVIIRTRYLVINVYYRKQVIVFLYLQWLPKCQW